MKSLLISILLSSILVTPSRAIDVSCWGGGTDNAIPIVVDESWRIKSSRLGEEREVTVYLPSNYTKAKLSYPVIYVLDGESIGQVAASAVQFMTTASELPQMPEAIIVAISNTDRMRDMPIPEEYGKRGEDKFLGFIADELVPAVDARYRTEHLRVLAGHSQGGTFVHYALVSRPTVFQWYLSLDAPLFGAVHPLLERARTLISKNNDFRGRLVTVENSLGWGKDWASLISAAPSGFYGAQVYVRDETHETMVFKGIYEGFKRLFHDYAPEAKDMKLEELETAYKMLSQSYGYQVNIPEPVLLRSASRNAIQQNGAESVKLVKRAVEIYGASPWTNRTMAEAEMAVQAGGPDPRVAKILNSLPPTPEQIKPFLGTWVGTMEVPGGDALNVAVTFEVVGGVVRAKERVSLPNSDPFSVQATFVRVSPGGELQWGGPNGRVGINVSTARLLDQNTLKGGQEALGVTPMAGRVSPPSPTFLYKRQSDRK
jgi:hypothetical protein